MKKHIKWKNITMTTAISCLVMLAVKNQLFGHEIDIIHIVLVSVAAVSLVGAMILQTIIDVQKMEDFKKV